MRITRALDLTLANALTCSPTIGADQLRQRHLPNCGHGAPRKRESPGRNSRVLNHGDDHNRFGCRRGQPAGFGDPTRHQRFIPGGWGEAENGGPEASEIPIGMAPDVWFGECDSYLPEMYGLGRIARVIKRARPRPCA
jgi:hypothetical protein